MWLTRVTFAMGVFVLLQALGRVSRGQAMPWEDKAR